MIPISLIMRLAPYVICLTMGFGGGWKLAADHYKAIIADMKDQAQKAYIEQQQKVIKTEQNQQAITQKVSTDYESKLQSIRQAYSFIDAPPLGLRGGTTTSTSNLPSVSNSAGRSHGIAGCDQLPTKLRQAAEEQTQQLIYLQDWIRQQAESAR